MDVPVRGVTTVAVPWYREVTRDQWLAFWATMSGWILDAFDYNILAIILLACLPAVFGALVQGRMCDVQNGHLDCAFPGPRVMCTRSVSRTPQLRGPARGSGLAQAPMRRRGGR